MNKFWKTVIGSVIAGVIVWIITTQIIPNIPWPGNTPEASPTPAAAVVMQPQEQKANSLDINSILMDANTAFKSNGYLAALDIINDGLLTDPQNSELNQAWKEYNSYAPISISKFPQLKNTATGSYSGTYIDNQSEDKFGNQYMHSFALSGKTVSFYVGKKYASLRGVIACPKEYDYNSARKSATITIYLDGEKKFISNTFEVDSRPQPFEIPLKGVDEVEIEWTCIGMNIWENWGYYATLFDTEFVR